MKSHTGKIGTQSALVALFAAASCIAGCEGPVEPDAGVDAGEPEPAFEVFGDGQLILEQGNGCRIAPDESIECWGRVPPASLPEGAFKLISLDFITLCGIRTDNTVACTEGFLEPPPGDIGELVDVEAGAFMACGVESDGTVVCWATSTIALNPQLVNGVPAGGAKDIELSEDWGCIINDADGIECWGEPTDARVNPPTGAFLQIDINFRSGCGIRDDGTLACWGIGDSTAGVPSGEFTSVSVGLNFSCAVRAGARSLECWGTNVDGQASPPGAGAYDSVACGERGACAIRSDGSVLCWGNDDAGGPPP